MSFDISKRNLMTDQVTGDSKAARLTDAENFALNIYGADKTLKEFLGPRADNSTEKQQMYSDIANNGYVRLDDLESDIEDSQTLNTVDVFFLAAGIKTDLVTSGLELRRTELEKEKKDSISSHTSRENE